MSNSKNKISSIDALKSLDQVVTVDPRNNHIEIESWYDRIAKITLVEMTPIEVKQLFENAKNIALYTYFAYRLHQAAEMMGFLALEKALKIKYDFEEKNIESTPKKLSDYMNIALDQNWITDVGYESSRHIAMHRVQSKLIYDLIDKGELEKGEPIPVPEPTNDEIETEMKSMGIAKKRLHAGRRIRNSLAHGGGGLAPTSIGTLKNIAEEINQLFG